MSRSTETTPTPSSSFARPATGAEPRPPQVLKNLRITSLALNLPGPAALMRLRAMGAKCLKIEPPSGDPMARYSADAYAALHDGIKVTTLDLKAAEDQIKLWRQLEKTDVLLTSFRPSALRRLGLDTGTLRKRLPALSTVSIVGDFGERSERPGHDLTYLAEHGLITGTDLPATLYADMGGSNLAVEAVLQCALQRASAMTAKSGQPPKGLHLAVSLSQAVRYAALPREWQLTARRAVIGGAHAGYRVYACRNGRVAIAALEPHFGACLCKAVGLAVEAGEVTQALTQPVAHRHMEDFFSRLNRTEVEQLALLYDLPLQVLHD